MAQLDGLRAIAVCLVMVAHFCPMSWVPIVEPLGPMGVRLFFVLSGFLITGILLRARDRMQDQGVGRWEVFKWFYARRTLRIFPMFYLVLVLTTLVDIKPVRETFWWHAGYLSNFLFASLGDWYGRASHFWSLAVEEQFYLVWPWVVLCLPAASLLPVIGVALTLGPLSRWAGMMAGQTEVTVSVLPQGCLDTLGMGALLAYLWHRGLLDAERRRIWGRRLLAVAVPVWTVLLASHLIFDSGIWTVTFTDTASGVVFLVLVDRTARGFTGRVGRFLSAPSMRYVGQISYSVYIIHNFMPHILKPVFLSMNLPWSAPVSSPVQTVILFTASLAAASLTWKFVEAPINEFKDRVEFPRPSTPTILREPAVVKS